MPQAVHRHSRIVTLAGLALVVISAATSLVTAQPRPEPAAAAPATKALPVHTPRPPAAAKAGLRTGPGYWLAAADGGVFSYGRAGFVGGAAAMGLRKPLAGMAVTPSGLGYWLAGRDGGVFSFGDAGFHGAVANLALNNSIVTVVGTPTGKGYWLAGSDGGVFAFGDAGFFGALAGKPLNQPIVGMAATVTGKGYWLVAKDGGVFSYGDAVYRGGASAMALNRGIVAITATPSGDGYWLAGADGGVFSYGDAGYWGSAIGALPTAPIVGMAVSKSGQGYWLAGADGGVFAFGDSGFYGAPAEDGASRARIVGIASGIGTAVKSQNRALAGTFGWDVSWPQCNNKLPEGGYAFAVVGVTGGHQFSENRCLASEFRWALRHNSVASVYVNVNWPSVADEGQLPVVAGSKCPPGDLNCQAYWWGYRGVEYALDLAGRHHVSTPMWWLDVETTNRWSPLAPVNALVVKGAIEGLQAHGAKVGLYSSQYQWNVITGGYAPGLPTWIAGPRNAAEAPPYCAPAKSFGGGTPWLVQFPNGLDGNIACEAGAKALLSTFRLPPPPPVPEFPED